jgi:hypothetical protein
LDIANDSGHQAVADLAPTQLGSDVLQECVAIAHADRYSGTEDLI